ncbi:MAG: hypothetical protein M1815_001650 [Lichina confinis]|nr:MAG: hypothetical protein M1815_001650 [Lichina confinis]
MPFSSASPVVVLPASSHPQSFGARPSPGSVLPFGSHRHQFSKSLPASFAQWPHSATDAATVKSLGATAAGPPRTPASGPHQSASANEAAWRGIMMTTTTTVQSSACGRKRCRDEYALADDNVFTSGVLSRLPVPGPAHRASDSGASSAVGPLAVAAANGTSDWLDDGLGDASCPVASMNAAFSTTPKTPGRPIINAHRKLQRLDSAASLGPRSADTAATGTMPAGARDGGDAPPKPQPAEPVVDDLTLRLGIGWTRLGADPDKQAAARGWARYIEKHFPSVSGARILLQSKRLDDAFLVVADQGYFLVDEKMAEARLVGSTEQQALANLTAVPVVFVEGSEVLRAVSVPRRDVGGDAAPQQQHPPQLAISSFSVTPDATMDAASHEDAIMTNEHEINDAKVLNEVTSMIDRTAPLHMVATEVVSMEID